MQFDTLRLRLIKIAARVERRLGLAARTAGCLVGRAGAGAGAAQSG
jgi:hypothetical protein